MGSREGASMQMPSVRKWTRWPLPALALAATFTLAACDIDSTPATVGTEDAAVRLIGSFPNSSGAHATIKTTGSIDPNNLFFKSLGTNGRSCVTCHQPNAGWKSRRPTCRPGSTRPGGHRSDLPHQRRLQLPQGRRFHRGRPPHRLQHAADQGAHPRGHGVPATASSPSSASTTPTACQRHRAVAVPPPVADGEPPVLCAVMWDGRETSPGRNRAGPGMTSERRDVGRRARSVR